MATDPMLPSAIRGGSIGSIGGRAGGQFISKPTHPTAAAQADDDYGCTPTYMITWGVRLQSAAIIVQISMLMVCLNFFCM